MSCIYQVCLVHSFEGELCFLIQFWLQHYFVLNHNIGMQHWITHKHMKWEFRYPLYIRGICHTYTAAVHIPGIYMVYTNYIPRRGSRWYPSLLFAIGAVFKTPQSNRDMCAAMQRAGRQPSENSEISEDSKDSEHVLLVECQLVAPAFETRSTAKQVDLFGAVSSGEARPLGSA